MGVSGVIGGHGGMAPQPAEPALAAVGVLPAVRGREEGSTSTSVGFASRNVLVRSPPPSPPPPPVIAVTVPPVGVPGSYRRISIWLARRLGPPLAVVVAVITDSFRAVAVLAKPLSVMLQWWLL